MKSTPISEIMTTKIDTVTPDQKLVDVKHIYEKENFHHHIPVVENGKLVGMVSLIDFMRKADKGGLFDDADVYQNTTVKEIMSGNPYFLYTEDTVSQGAEILAKGEFHALPVLKGEEVVGIVSTADIIRFFLKK
ncbi:MAG: CBS domain-containing protein [Crocinitomicaceae bacterium]|nr:CBS domain-containing protein [Crocinitomicaceae bacterium]